ncbi:hypothetical protein F2Q70_00003642 [Brassica cretica]|uniref:Arabidopsis retrotransposon Orf1 C-terminal domain-containing protein n=1 Tax=Brassica cretica TaxID=69181 RepID=A0A8S9J4H5_BRACR|nr:hypothetical protein F2Q70_00003642 [Brassica cretica]
MAPRRTKAASRIKRPYARGEPEDYTVPSTYPWPQKEGTEISLTDLNIPKSSETKWDKEASRRYNTLLNTNIFPTRFVDAGALSNLGLHEDLHAILQVLGIADLCHRTHPLYPDLVRQVLATAELTFKKPGFPIFEEASFTFFASGFIPEQAFWKFIASRDFKSRLASQYHIHNHVLRITAKVLSNLLFSKDQTSKVTRGELQMLWAGVEDELKSSDIGIPTAPMTTSPSYVLVRMFVDKKARLVKGSLKKYRSGSLLTPLFRHLELDLSDGRNLYCKLPQPNITSLSDVTNIYFVPDAQYLCADPKSSYRDDVEFVRTDGGDNAYDLGPLDDNADDATYHRWMVESQRKNNSLMKRILKAISGGCMGAPSTYEPRQDQPTPRSHRPGKEPAGTARGDEETPWATPRRRNMRSTGQSESDDTE